MTWHLAIGDRSHSSWSLSGWLFFEKFGLAVTGHGGRLYTDDFARLVAQFAPARQGLGDGDGLALTIPKPCRR